MSDTFNEAIFPCGDPAALVAYLYDDCEPGERERIAVHVATCAACTAELEGLSAARGALAAWTPPAAALGFQITSAEAASGRADPSGPADGPFGLSAASGAGAGESGRVLRPSRWWQRPLPAWGQVAAAMLIFVAGLAAGAARDDAGGSPTVPGAPVASVPSATTRATGAVGNGSTPGARFDGIERVSSAGMVQTSATPADLARLAGELRAEMAKVAAAAKPQSTARVDGAAVAAPIDEDALIARVKTLVEESERRQRAELVLVAEALGNLDAQRRYDLAGVQRRVEGLRGLTATEVKQNRDAISAILNVVYSPGQGAGVRTVGGR